MFIKYPLSIRTHFIDPLFSFEVFVIKYFIINLLYSVLLLNNKYNNFNNQSPLRKLATYFIIGLFIFSDSIYLIVVDFNSNKRFIVCSILINIANHLFIILTLLKKSKKHSVPYHNIINNNDKLYDTPQQIDYNQINSDSEILSRLVNKFESEKLYLQKDITLKGLAAEVYTNRTYLSRALNSLAHKNFNEFINYYRIREICCKFIGSPQTDIKDLYQECGFKSFSSANNAFKTILGYTIGEWAKEIRLKIESNEKVEFRDYVQQSLYKDSD